MSPIQAIEQLRTEFDRLEREIKELREGACRQHCRTALEWFYKGWDDRSDVALMSRLPDLRKEAYQHERKRQQT